MNYIRKINFNLKNPLKTQVVNFIWGNDGWCYIPELKIRQKYTETKYFMEEWNGIIPMPCHHEKLNGPYIHKNLEFGKKVMMYFILLN